ncbi:universal stress protein [Yinghuangia seranimata]|uniref:universal stress protein n=1 Tax=Yinghuangia seranimata TaxID=408067 RepID=UPI00248B5C4C|nr:universal stress protein [Yinghuangia seranimata]MDI2129521.1 universal stress protein [Yinghuangia seranimata]
MDTHNPNAAHITVAVDGSTHAGEALRWAAQEARARGLALRIMHAWLPLPMPGGRAASLAESTSILDQAEVQARAFAPGLDVTTVSAADLVGAAIAEESTTAAMLVLGSRGRGGFRSLLLGSTSLTAAAIARCPVVIVREALPVEGPARVRDVVVGLDLDDVAADVLAFAFEEAAAHPAAGLRVLHGWTTGASAVAGGPVFDKAAVEEAATRSLAEATAGWSEKYPQIDILRAVAHDAPAAALVGASRHAALTVVGRRRSGTSLGLKLGPVAHAVLLHAHGPVAVVPY